MDVFSVGAAIQIVARPAKYTGWSAVPFGKTHISRGHEVATRRDDGRGVNDRVFDSRPRPTVSDSLTPKPTVCGRGTVGCPAEPKQVIVDERTGTKTTVPEVRHCHGCNPATRDILAQKQHIRS